MLLRFILYRYDLRVQGMLLRLEFTEKKGDLEPALKTFHEAVDGGDVYHIANTYTITNCYIVFSEIWKSESLKDLFYVILVIGNMINAVSYPICT